MLFQKHVPSTWQLLPNRQILGMDLQKPCKLNNGQRARSRTLTAPPACDSCRCCYTVKQRIRSFSTRSCAAQSASTFSDILVRRHRNEIALCFFINPVFFVEEVKWTTRDHLQNSASSSSSLSGYFFPLHSIPCSTLYFFCFKILFSQHVCLLSIYCSRWTQAQLNRHNLTNNDKHFIRVQ